MRGLFYFFYFTIKMKILVTGAGGQLGQEFKNNISITGEINLQGLVLIIGGLEEKLLGAKKAGVNMALIPYGNLKDIERIKKRNRDGESNISLDYLKKCEEYHEDWFKAEKKIITFDGNKDTTFHSKYLDILKQHKGYKQ